MICIAAWDATKTRGVLARGNHGECNSATLTDEMSRWLRLVDRYVLRRCHKLQVLWPVVSAIPVDVVNMLATLKRTPKRLLYNETVFKEVTIPIPNQNIPSFIDSILATRKIRAARAAKPTLALSGQPWERGLAVFTAHQLPRNNAPASNVRRIVARTTTEPCWVRGRDPERSSTVLARTVGSILGMHYWSLHTGSGVPCRGWLQPRSGVSRSLNYTRFDESIIYLIRRI